MILCICSFVLALVSIAFTWHLSIVYNRFNNQIKDWALKLDESTKSSIELAARQILRQALSEIDSVPNPQVTNLQKSLPND